MGLKLKEKLFLFNLIKVSGLQSGLHFVNEIKTSFGHEESLCWNIKTENNILKIQFSQRKWLLLNLREFWYDIYVLFCFGTNSGDINRLHLYSKKILNRFHFKSFYKNKFSLCNL